MKQMLVEALQKVWWNWIRENVRIKPENQEEKSMDATKRILRFLEKRYDFRYNRLMGVTEYRRRGMKGRSSVRLTNVK